MVTTLGKTPKPLSILLHPTLESWPEFQDFKAQGHKVVTVQDLHLANVVLGEMDLVLGPTCWRMDAQHRKYLPVAIAAARKVRYPKETIK